MSEQTITQEQLFAQYAQTEVESPNERNDYAQLLVEQSHVEAEMSTPEQPSPVADGLHRANRIKAKIMSSRQTTTHGIPGFKRIIDNSALNVEPRDFALVGDTQGAVRMKMM